VEECCPRLTDRPPNAVTNVGEPEQDALWFDFGPGDFSKVGDCAKETDGES